MAPRSLIDFSPDWWAATQGEGLESSEYAKAIRAFEDWESRARRQTYAALVDAMIAAQEASRAREKALRAYNKKIHSDTEKAIEAYETLLNARAKQYAAALGQYRIQINTVDAAAKRAVDDAEAVRSALKAIRKKLDSAEMATAKAIDSGTDKRVERALALSSGAEEATDKAIAIWEGALRELSAALANGATSKAASEKPAKPKKKKPKAKTKKKAKKAKSAKG